MQIAITRGVSPSINLCELSFLSRQKIDVARAVEQHRQYEECLRSLGFTVISLPAEPDLPDSMFVEDPALVVEELAVMNCMGAESRRPETKTLAPVLARYRALRWMEFPAQLEGGDVLRVGTTLFVGISDRSNGDGMRYLDDNLRPFGYTIVPVAVWGCLHLKSACSALGDGAILMSFPLVDPEPFLRRYQVIQTPPDEPGAANVLTVGDTVVMPDCFPQTAQLLDGLGWKVRTLDISELMKAEAGVTCSSILLESGSVNGPREPSPLPLYLQ